MMWLKNAAKMANLSLKRLSRATKQKDENHWMKVLFEWIAIIIKSEKQQQQLWSIIQASLLDATRVHSPLYCASRAELLRDCNGNALGLTPSTECRHYPPRRVATFLWHPASTGDLPCTTQSPGIASCPICPFIWMTYQKCQIFSTPLEAKNPFRLE